jgi:hypothetical protein
MAYTCAEYRTVIQRKVVPTQSEFAALVVHQARCADCLSLVQELAGKSSPEALAQGHALAVRWFRDAARDPEVWSVLRSVGPSPDQWASVLETLERVAMVSEALAVGYVDANDTHQLGVIADRVMAHVRGLTERLVTENPPGMALAWGMARKALADALQRIVERLRATAP